MQLHFVSNKNLSQIELKQQMKRKSIEDVLNNQQLGAIPRSRSFEQLYSLLNEKLINQIIDCESDKIKSNNCATRPSRNYLLISDRHANDNLATIGETSQSELNQTIESARNVNFNQS